LNAKTDKGLLPAGVAVASSPGELLRRPAVAGKVKMMIGTAGRADALGELPPGRLKRITAGEFDRIA